ncbi:SGNH/GDSL hydrolase family protein [Amycolatopsis magusensis]|uniref:SGNH/GDSL hydrolase family protein n=1 Tax=Amycolatopsis magusensis TaxID=882444 RepID=UPI0037BB4AD1
MNWRRSTGLAVAAVAAATALTAAPAGATQAFQHYVALGDSYTAGPLIPWQRGDPPGCRRSSANYPAVLAEQLGVRSYVDKSCSGADSTHLTQPQRLPFGGSHEPQADVLRAETDFVTVGLGGNDYNLFSRIIEACPQLRKVNPVGSPCQEHFTVDGIDTLKATAGQIEGNLRLAFQTVRSKAPRATVLAIGYPRIAPEAGYCPSVLPFADGDYAWVNDIEEALNAAIATAAGATGVSYVDTYGPSLGHDACAGDAAWVNGKRRFAQAAPYHPFAAGMQGIAGVVQAHLRGKVIT